MYFANLSNLMQSTMLLEYLFLKTLPAQYHYPPRTGDHGHSFYFDYSVKFAWVEWQLPSHRLVQRPSVANLEERPAAFGHRVRGKVICPTLCLAY
ncbi:hypothetical protein CDAR_522991 [Caerostris darwini]|uniref:Uncharacterized protein n=1 Tax=Caerostris darwini TaxID=1538125 RepID=A0AAV4TE68_9ARAC|nr:hypothetical protein CDAR_522991 [Caerostris darwini]